MRSGMHIVDTSGSYFGGLNGVLTATRIDDLPPVAQGFERIAYAADEAMIQVLASDLEFAEVA